MTMKVVEYKGKPGATWEQATTDTAVGLTAANIVDAQGNLATSCVIQALDNTAKIAVGGATPVAGASSGLGYELQDGDFLTLEGAAAVSSAKVLSAVSGGAAVSRLEITAYFGA